MLDNDPWLAVRFLCSRTRELEARVEKCLAERCYCERQPTLPFSIHRGKGNPVLFRVIFDRDEDQCVFVTESQPTANSLCWYLNEFLVGRVSGLTAED